MLLDKIEAGEIDPSHINTYRTRQEYAPALHKTLRDTQDGCIKVVLTP